jgi:hypothetical protein
MKLSKQALIAAAVTGLLPAGAEAVGLNQNLITNPSFENIGAGADNPAIDWMGNVSTYAYSQNYTAPGPAGGGLRYWFGGGSDPLAFQLVDLAGNAAQIDAGQIRYNLSAFFSTYLLQRDFGTVRALFLDGGNAELGRASVGGATFVGNLPAVPPDQLREWGQDMLGGLLPVGTRTVRIELDGEKEVGVGSVADGYIDLVNFQLTPVPEPGTFSLFALGLVGGWVCWRRRR